MKLRNDNVLVFGGGSGIGLAIARRLTAAGARVVLCGRTPEKLQRAAQEVCGAQTLVGDIADVESHERLFCEASRMMDGLSAFVNAAAVSGSSVTGRGYEPWDITGEEWDKMTSVNGKGAFFLMRNEVNYLLEQGIHGNILNLASNAACMDIIGPYGADKTAVIGWTRAFGKRYGHQGIIINGIAPGATFTPMIARYAKRVDQPYERHAIERFIRPEEIAELAYYLMSDMGEIVCGHTVVADGGDNCAR